MSAPSLRNITQTSQREFALQRYYIFLIYAKKIATECDFFCLGMNDAACVCIHTCIHAYTMWNTLIILSVERRTLNQ